MAFLAGLLLGFFVGLVAAGMVIKDKELKTKRPYFEEDD